MTPSRCFYFRCLVFAAFHIPTFLLTPNYYHQLDFRKYGNNYGLELFSEVQLKNGAFEEGASAPAAKKAAPKKAAVPEKKGLASLFGKKPAAKK